MRFVKTGLLALSMCGAAAHAHDTLYVYCHIMDHPSAAYVSQLKTLPPSPEATAVRPDRSDFKDAVNKKYGTQYSKSYSKCTVEHEAAPAKAGYDRLLKQIKSEGYKTVGLVEI